VVGNIWIKLLTLLRTLLLIVLIVNYAVILAHVMSFFVDEFVVNSCLATLTTLKKTGLMLLATLYQLDIPTGARKVKVS